MRSYKIRKNKLTEESEANPQENIKTADDVVKTAEDLVETLVPGLSRSEFERIRQQAIEKARNTRHEWRMKGRGKLVCTSCEPQHTSHIPLDKILIGIDVQGNPIFKNENYAKTL